ncbi:hypothetical protein [Hyalangium gracile]|uniref:hypothetical protein n=1 Tax=Hyalangium gracile TaxID=394092 RepID=UPI001CCBF942|nr:hypothetical protein [Hyalangium gracile]
MSVRLAQAISRNGAAAQASKAAEPKREEPKSGTGKPAAGGGGAGKAAAGGKSGGAQGARRQEGAESGGQLGAYTGGFDSSMEEGHESFPRPRLSVINGEAAARPVVTQEQAQARPAPQMVQAPELSRERRVESRENSSSQQGGMDIRARLRAAVMDRVAQGMTDVIERLSGFLKAPGRLGVVNLSLVVSESALTYEVWREPSAVPERRARMAAALGLAPQVADAVLLRALMAEVHEAFVAFRASSGGRELMQRYEQVLRGYEEAKVLPVVPGHDTGPMLNELARVGLAHEEAFSRSLLVHPLLVAVALTPDEGTDEQVMIAGLTVPQLGMLVAQLRRVNPRLTNRQVCMLLRRVSTDREEGIRRCVGQAEVERVLESAYQLLRMTVFELFFV